MFSHCSPRFCPVISFFHSTRELRGCNRDPNTGSLFPLFEFRPNQNKNIVYTRRYTMLVRLQYLRSPTTFLRRGNVLHLRRVCLIVERGRLTPLTWVNAFSLPTTVEEEWTRVSRATLGLLSLLNGENKLLMPNRSPVKIERPLYEFGGLVVVISNTCSGAFTEATESSSSGCQSVATADRSVKTSHRRTGWNRSDEKMENEWCVVA